MGTVTPRSPAVSSARGAERTAFEGLDADRDLRRDGLRRGATVVVMDEDALADRHQASPAHLAVRGGDAMLGGHARPSDAGHARLHCERLAVEGRRAVDHPRFGEDEARLAMDAKADGLVQDLLEIPGPGGLDVRVIQRVVDVAHRVRVGEADLDGPGMTERSREVARIGRDLDPEVRHWRPALRFRRARRTLPERDGGRPSPDCRRWPCRTGAVDRAAPTLL